MIFMEGLIVIHTEIGSVDPEEMGEESVRNNRKLFEDIATEIQKYLQDGNKVYYLAEESDSPDSELIYPAIREHSPRMVYIHNEMNITSDLWAERQFLMAKDRVMADGLDKIVVCGVAYQSCVGDMYHLLLGEEGPYVTKESYQNEREQLGWSEEKFEQVYNARLNAHIRDELTDKLS